MSSTIGSKLKLSIYGESHGEAIGAIIDGFPSGIEIDMEALLLFMKRRSPSSGIFSTKRREADIPRFLSGVRNGVTEGSPICIIIGNTDARSSDYDSLRDIPRPGHADYTAYLKYGKACDMRGGGHFSGRLTAPLCAAGGMVKQLLERRGIEINAAIKSIGTASSPYETEELLREAAEKGESVGGIIECTVTGVPGGTGEPIFNGLEGEISRYVFSVPAVKGIEFGAGFAYSRMTGKKANDAYFVRDGKIITETNNCGGILGGISNGMPIVFRAVIKPTPSISMEQQSVSLSGMKDVVMSVSGRHDSCIVPRALPCIESACALAIYELLP